MRFLKRLGLGLLLSFGLAGLVGALMDRDAAVAAGIFGVAFSVVLAAQRGGDGRDGDSASDGDSSDSDASDSDGGGGGDGGGD